MLRRCEPLFEGDTREVCGALFDDNRRLTHCPHVSLDGGDTVGVPADPQYLVQIGIPQPAVVASSVPPDGQAIRVYHYQTFPQPHEVAGWLNRHREHQPVAVWTGGCSHTGGSYTCLLTVTIEKAPGA